MDLNAILAELQRRKAQAGQRISDLFQPGQQSTDNFNISGYPTLEQTPSSDQLKAYAAQVAKEYAQRAAEGIVPAPIRAREQAMRTDPAAAARPFTSQEVQQSVPYITAAAPIAYHGSPHEFTQFDASKIGTGQGAQSYGHGLYFAENPQVAQSYVTAGQENGWKIGDKVYHGLTSRLNATPENYAANALSRFKGNVDEAIQWLRDDIPSEAKAKGFLRRMVRIGAPIEEASGNTYRVNIPDEHVAKMLDWDKPLSEQAPEVRKILDYQHGINDPNVTGEKIYKSLLSDYGGNAQEATDSLARSGIPGIKYLDQGSRGYNVERTMGGAGDWIATNFNGQIIAKDKTREAVEAAIKSRQSRNFVVFDPAILKDVSRQ
jgi:hypothetical protein